MSLKRMLYLREGLLRMSQISIGAAERLDHSLFQSLTFLLEAFT
jgi:hypothetical protein